MSNGAQLRENGVIGTVFGWKQADFLPLGEDQWCLIKLSVNRVAIDQDIATAKFR